MNSDVNGRFFIVGCVRSGTTLLQSIIASHPLCQSFPETHFFPHIQSTGWKKKLGMVNRSGVKKFENFINEGAYKIQVPKPSGFSFFIPAHIHYFVNVLDNITISNKKSFWVEKTPRHLYHIDLIEKYIKAKFIHVLRNGEDVVASLYEAAKEYPQTWSGPLSIEHCINRWNKDIEISGRYKNFNNHLIIQYVDLVTNTEDTIRDICSFLGISFTIDMLNRKNETAKDIILANEKWKNNTFKTISTNKVRKFDSLFNENEKSKIRNTLIPHM